VLKQSGRLVVLSSPSGGGKTTIIQSILKRFPDFKYSVSATTRPPRTDEVNGRDYYFLSRKNFLQKCKQNEFLEWARVHDHFYGTPKQPILSFLQNGLTVLLDIDVQGGIQIKRSHPGALLIFLVPPGLDVLRERLKNRGTENQESLKTRLRNARHEIDLAVDYDKKIINDDLDRTIQEVIETIVSNP